MGWGSGWVIGWGVWDLGFRVWDVKVLIFGRLCGVLGFRIWGLGIDFGFQVWGLVSNLGIWDKRYGFRVGGFGF